MHLAVMNIGRSHSVLTSKAMINIDADTILVPVMIDAILLNPATVYVSLPQSLWVFVPTFWHPSCFDFRVLFAGFALLGNRYESCVDDLATSCL